MAHKKERHAGTGRSKLLLVAVIFITSVILLAAAVYFFNFMQSQLHDESVSQLEELSQQLFEKLEVQIDLQWDYLEKADETLEKAGSYTKQELSELFLKLEDDLSPAGKRILFRAIDEDGYYYTDEGRQGLWTGLDLLTDKERQSFLIANWLDSDSYMAFTSALDYSLTVDGRKISHIVLLRDMNDMAPYFHSSAFENNNMFFITDDSGFTMYEDGSLSGVEFDGRNLYSSMRGLGYPHMGSFDSILGCGAYGEVVCTDVTINGGGYFLIYARLPQYDWCVTMLVSSKDVAVSATNMMNSMMRMFLIFTVICVSAVIVVLMLAMRFRRDRRLLAVREAANQELRAANDRTEEALRVAQEATKAKSQFLSNMSHDIRTPMNAIMGVTSLMEHEVNSPEKMRYYIKKLRTSGRHMLGLINDILDMSKIESGEVTLNTEQVKMSEQVGQVESIIRSQASEKGQTFNVTVHELAHEYLIGDPVRIRQVYLNLLSNAVKYTPVGGTITFDITELPSDDPKSATILTSVIDNGIGMSEEFLTRIFDPFSRERSSLTNKVQGTGLGMSITKSLVDLMQGEISVQSEQGKGSRFDVKLTLPIDPDAVRAVPVSDLLLVSDDEQLITNMRAALTGTYVTMRVADTPENAVTMLRETPSDAIILSGYISSTVLAQTVALLRSAAGQNALIFCCDYAYRDQVRDALVGSDVNGLISRPFFFENLLLAVEHAHEGTSSVSPESHHSSLNGKRFLCAEDNELNAEILEALLKLHGASCRICEDGAEIVREFADVQPGQYDAILMDVQMPNMNGMEATRAIRAGKNPLGKTIPIIAMTANAFSSDVQECLEAGMDAHIAKPLDISALERTVEIFLGSNAEGGGTCS